MKTITTIISAICLSCNVLAQMHPICPGGGAIPSDFCATTCISCVFENGVTLNTGDYTPDYPAYDCLGTHNNFWFGFIAHQTSATFTVTPSNCTLNQYGIQMALYDDCDNPCVVFDYGCSGDDYSPHFTVDLVVGQTYFLVVDGCWGDVCDAQLTVDPIEAISAPPLVDIGPVQGPSAACPNAALTYCVEEIIGEYQYIWTIPPDATLNGMQGPGPITLTGFGSNCVEVKFGSSTGSKQVCAKLGNGCSTGPQKCKSVNVQKIPETVVPPVYICQNDADSYVLPWGGPVSANPGTQTYQATLSSYLGCDSIVKQSVTIMPAKNTTLPAKTICTGECEEVGGEYFCESGNYSTTLSSYQGCDSVVNFSLTVIDIDAQITYSGNLSCNNPAITLYSNNQPLTQKIWRNAQGQALGTGDNLVVTQPGLCYLTVTENFSGKHCSLTDSVIINSDFTIPSVTATATGYLGCTTNAVQLNALTNGINPTFLWSGPNNFTDSVANPVPTVAGVYSVTVTAANGCTAIASTTVQTDTIPPSIEVFSDTITCSSPAAMIQASTDATDAAFIWNGPGVFAATVADTLAVDTGAYTVVVTNLANGCTAAATTFVGLQIVPPDIAILVPDTIGCLSPEVTLSANTLAGIDFLWAGPDSFFSAQQFPVISTAGFYTVTVHGANGCTNTASVDVTGDTIPPNTWTSGDTLTCSIQSVVINGYSDTQGVDFSWSGPNGFTSNSPDPEVEIAGEYVLTVTGQNGCTSIDTANVVTDYSPPDIVANGGIITCSDIQTFIAGSSTTSGTTFQWSGPGNFYASQASDTVNVPGDYLLTATAPNGCTSTTIATVTTNFTIPDITLVGDTLTCSVQSVTLIGGSTAPGVFYAWTGPNGFNAATEDVVVDEVGAYSLTVTDPSNGCTATASTFVTIDDTEPGAEATGGVVTCSTPSLTLQGNSPTAGVEWSWTGPGNFISNDQHPQIFIDGIYTLIVTDSANGCTSVATTEVQADQDGPQVSAVAGTLTCLQTSLTLTGNSTLPGMYNWSGPNGYISNLQNPTVNEPGNYTLIVIAQNGCADTAVVSVDQNTVAPDVTVLGDTIDCVTGLATLMASSATSGVTWVWSGPDNFSSTQQNPATTVAGSYVVTGISPNGCSATDSTQISLNSDAPQISLIGAEVLTCALTSIELTVAGMEPGMTGQWDNGYTTMNLTVAAPGIYTYSAVSQNGCIATASVSIIQDIQAPQNVTASGGETDCDTQVITINGNSDTPNVSWLWTGLGNYTSTNQNPNDVSIPGTYTLQVSDLANGCTAIALAEVTQDLAAPVITVTTDSLTCAVKELALETVSDMPNVSFQWSGPGNFSSVQEDPIITLPGLYTVLVTASNGCSTDFSITVHQNTVAPEVFATGDTLTCALGGVSLGATTSTADATYSWSGPDNFSSGFQNPLVNTAGNYLVTVTGANGCSSTAVATVFQNSNAPQISALGGTITCALDFISLSVTSNVAVDFQWVGPDNFSSSLPNPTVGTPGTYTLTGTAQNGCTATATATVLADNQPPVFSISPPQELDCFTTQTSLNAVVQGTGNFSFEWSSQTGHFVSGTDTPEAVVSLGGPYTLTVTNEQNGCSASQTVVVQINSDVPANIALKTKDITCFGYDDGTIEVDSVEGGTAPFLFALDGNILSGVTNFQGLSPGIHIVRLQDAVGCELEVQAVVHSPGPLSVILGADTTLHLGNPILLPVLSATNDPLRVTKVVTQPLILTADSVIYPLQSFVYSLMVSDSSDCSASDQMRITVDKKRQVYIPNIFNPEVPENAIFKIYGGNDVRIVRSFRIYDRWGSQVHEAEMFTPDDYSAGWNGMVKGQKAVPAVFMYFAEIEFIDGEIELFTGDVTLIRN